MKERFRRTCSRVEAYFTSDVLSFRALVRIVLPVFWEQAFLALLAIFTIWMLSFDGANAVSVVNMMAVVNKVFTCACLGLVTGGTVLVAQNVGARRAEAAGRSMGQAMALAVAVTAVIGGALLVFRRPLVGYLLEGAGEEIISQAVLYFTGFCVTFPCYAFYQGFAGGMRGWGKTAAAWRITLAVNCAELGLTALFLLGLRMGVFGITLALMLSRVFGALLALVMLLRRRRDLCLRWRACLRPDPAILRGILIIAVPLALEQFFFNSGKAVSQRFIADYGTDHMAANGVINAVFDLFNLPQISLREALVTVVGMCIGCGRADLARRYIYRFLRTIRVVLVVLLPITVPLALLLIHAYGLPAESNRLAALSLLLIYTFGPLFLGGSLTIPAGLRAGGDASYVSATALGCMWLVRVTLSWLFARVLPLGVIGINLAMVIEWAVRGQFFRLRLKGSAWHSHKLLREA